MKGSDFKRVAIGLDSRGLCTFYNEIWIPCVADMVLYDLARLGGTYSLAQREIALQYENYPLRNCVFRTGAEFLQLLQERCRSNAGPPINIHFGPIWPGNHLALQPLWPPDKSVVPIEFPPNIDVLKPREFERRERGDSALGEMIIDVDMDITRRRQYCVCACGAEPRVCQTCWTALMLPAQRVLERVTRHYFGFKRMFTVFSGRRGFHIWLMDHRVLAWTASERLSFMAALTAPLRFPDNETSPLSAFVWETLLKSYAMPGESRPDVFRRLYPSIDEAVGTDPTHLHKLPLMLNQHTGYFCDILGDPEDPEYRFEARPDQIYTLINLTPRTVIACVRHLRSILAIN